MEIFIAFLLGCLIAANVSSVSRFFSLQAFFEGVLRGLKIGEKMKKPKDKK